MATIKAGTYRFNDVLNTTYNADADINFTVSGYIAEYGVDVVAYFNRINNGYIAADDIEMNYRLVSTTPDLGVEAGYHIVYTATGTDGGWRNEEWQTDLQTITIPYDQEVSDEFYEWFSENAKPFTSISGTWIIDDIPKWRYEHYEKVNFSSNENHYIAFNLHNGSTFDELRYYYSSFEYGYEDVYYRDEFTIEWHKEAYKTITFEGEQSVSQQFYDWLTANAVEQKQISGVWKLNSTIQCIPYERFEVSADGESRRAFLDAHGANIVPVPFSIDGYVGTVVRVSPAIVTSDVWVDEYPTVFYEEVVCEVEIEGIGLDVSHFNPHTFVNALIDFGPEPQWVSAEFYDWLAANANPVTDEGDDEPTPIASIHYNGSVIASLNGGQTATLKCEGMRMESDVVVEVKEQKASEPVLQEKTVTENGEVVPDEGYDGLSKVTVAVEGSGGGGAIDLANIPEVDSIENPTESSSTAVRYDGEIYLLCEGELTNG